VPSLDDLIKEMKSLSSKQKAKECMWFFKTGKGQYGEGDIFLGIVVPKQHELAKKYVDLDLASISELLSSKYHEHRLTALLILVRQYQASKGDKAKKRIVNFYLKNRKGVNNWDLVDLSAPKILSPYLMDKNKTILYQFAKSGDLWERRIAILGTFDFIRNNKFEDSLKISQMLLQDKHDLMHKAVGWMLREIGKRDEKTLVKFLDKHHKKMPRTMLRYAIEKFDEKRRMSYLAK
jgi:3-methyladenine DNA glycosylase AlkD